MAKSSSKRVRGTAVAQSSIADKKFDRMVDSEKRVNSIKIHPLIVAADLKRGSLSSLDNYLRQEGGIPDRLVSVALRQLISGSSERSDFRAVIIHHPEKKGDTGGRPVGAERLTQNLHAQIAEFFEICLAQEGKIWRANEITRKKFSCSKSTVERAVKASRARAKKHDEQQGALQMRNRSLEIARNKSKR